MRFTARRCRFVDAPAFERRSGGRDVASTFEATASPPVSLSISARSTGTSLVVANSLCLPGSRRSSALQGVGHSRLAGDAA